MTVPLEHNRHTIVISPVGIRDIKLSERISTGIRQTFGCKTEIISLLHDVNFALDTGRNQYYSTMILEKLAELTPPDAVKVLAVVSVDLFIPILTHVYGEAQLGGTASIVSTHRLKNDPSKEDNSPLFLERIVKEAVHELGHTFNLRHCSEHTCIMHYCRTLKDVDRKSDQFCRYCGVLIGDELKKLDTK